MKKQAKSEDEWRKEEEKADERELVALYRRFGGRNVPRLRRALAFARKGSRPEPKSRAQVDAAGYLAALQALFPNVEAIRFTEITLVAANGNVDYAVYKAVARWRKTTWCVDEACGTDLTHLVKSFNELITSYDFDADALGRVRARWFSGVPKRPKRWNATHAAMRQLIADAHPDIRKERADLLFEQMRASFDGLVDSFGGMLADEELWRTTGGDWLWSRIPTYDEYGDVLARHHYAAAHFFDDADAHLFDDADVPSKLLVLLPFLCAAPAVGFTKDGKTFVAAVLPD